ncbi:hypothetical protein V6N13_103214 [Hibiscus sabdariffa]
MEWSIWWDLMVEKYGEGGASLLFPRIYSPLVLYFVLLLIIFSRERMEVIISIVGSFAAKAAEYAVDPIARQLSYLFKPRSKFLNLRTKVQELKDARERVQQSVNSATRKGDVIFDDVQRWLTVVDEKISKEAATQLQDREEKATKRCFAGFCPDFKSSYPLSKKADKEANPADKLTKCRAKRLCQLEGLEVSNCENITELIEEKKEIGGSDILEFNQLRILKLIQLERFNGLSLVGLFDEKISCPVLEELKVEECHKLKYVFISSMVKSFVHLKRLEISKCDEMEVIIEGTLTTEGGINSSIRVFPKLDFLELGRLSKLRKFCCGINPIEFPSLKILMIWRCCALNTFTFDDGKNRVRPPHYLFNEEVIFPVLEKLYITGIDNLERLWGDQLVEHSFSKLTFIDLNDCPKLLNVFSSSMFSRLERLDSLSIQLCKSIEEIIYEGGSTSNGMPSLYPQFFQSDGEFPNLTSLILWNLPNLKSIHYNKMLTINWPSLKEMKVYGCEKVEIVFANSGETSSEQPLFWVNESTFPNLQELTLGMDVRIKDIIWHCQGQQQQQQNFVSHYFPNLKVVELMSYSEQVIVMPPYLISNLQTLVIWGCSFKEMIFQSEEGGEEKPASLLLSHITKLRLDSLSKLMHLWKEKEGFPNLRILYVSMCPRLKVNLVPSSVSFRNLVTLEIRYCSGIIKLITHSTAKSLVQLQQMRIEKCRNIEEIIQGGDDDDDDDDDEISFPQLNSLELVSLPKLESFCSSDKYTFGFPSLHFLLLHKCPEMKMFSQGHSNTPLLHKVRFSKWSRKEEERWEGSLDSTIEKLFREKHPMIEECENFKEDRSKPSTSNTQNLKKEVQNSHLKCMAVEN